MKIPESARWLGQDLLRQVVRAWGQRRGQWRVEGAALARLDGWRIAEDRWGNRYLADLGSYIDSHVYLFGAYEAAHVEMLRELVQRHGIRTVLDIGANVGAITVPLAAMSCVERVHAFEPDPRNRIQLQANLMLNGLDAKVQVWDCALSDQAGQANLHTTSRGSAGRRNAGMSSLERDSGGPTVSVPLRRLDDVLDLRGESILVKIDVEGHELPLLRGGLQTLALNQVWMLVESFADKWPAVQDVLRSVSLAPLGDPRVAADNHLWHTIDAAPSGTQAAPQAGKGR